MTTSLPGQRPMIDTARRIDTPEGVQLGISPAGPAVRILAFALDLLLRGVVLVAISMATRGFGDFGLGLALLCAFLLEWLYPVLFEVLNNGATPGKRLLRIRVVDEFGVPVGWSGSMVRNLLRAVDFLPFAYGFGLLSMFLSADFKRLGDLAAGTMVVYEDPPPAPVAFPEVEPARPPWPLEPEEQQALIAFAERAGALNAERADEIAAVLGPLGGGSTRRLCQYAAWVHGGR